MTILKTLGISALLLLLAAPFALSGLGWTLVNAKIRNEFGNVPRMTTAELAGKLKSAIPPLLLDVRTEAEYAVSHLEGAVQVDPAAAAEAVKAPPEREIVTYCSVGYRSARFAQRLRAANFSHVANLEGSIFQWANESRLLVRGSERVSVVHPYNEIWGKLLAPEHRAKVEK